MNTLYLENDIICVKESDLYIKNGSLYINTGIKHIKIKRNIRELLIILLNNIDKIISNLTNSPKYQKQLENYIYEEARSNGISIYDYTVKQVVNLPLLNDESIAFISYKQMINDLENFKSEVENIFKWDSKKRKYIYERKRNYTFPKKIIEFNKDKSKSVKYFISNLSDFLSLSTLYIKSSNSAISKCIICNSYYINNSGTLTCSSECCKKSKGIKNKKSKSINSPEVRKLINCIRSYLNRYITNEEKRNQRERLKEKFELDLKNKILSLKDECGENYNSVHCQKKLYDWLKSYFEELHSLFPNKKIGNTNSIRK